MNARAGDNSRIKLIDALVKMLSISSTEASTLLTRLLRNTVEDTMSADKLNALRTTVFAGRRFRTWIFDSIAGSFFDRIWIHLP